MCVIEVQTIFSLINFSETKVSDLVVPASKKAYTYKALSIQIPFTCFNSVPNITRIK